MMTPAATRATPWCQSQRLAPAGNATTITPSASRAAAHTTGISSTCPMAMSSMATSITAAATTDPADRGRATSTQPSAPTAAPTIATHMTPVRSTTGP